MTKPIARDLMYRGRAFEAEVIELCVRWYIELSTLLSRPGRDDGRAWHPGRSHHNPSMGPPIRSRV